MKITSMLFVTPLSARKIMSLHCKQSCGNFLFVQCEISLCVPFLKLMYEFEWNFIGLPSLNVVRCRK